MNSLKNKSPFHECGREYWEELVGHYDRKHVRWKIPRSWDECPPDIKCVTIERMYDHIVHPHISEETEHHKWVCSKFETGYRGGRYNIHGPKKTHPMLKHFSECPKWFQDVTGIFCSVTRLWKPRLIKELDQIYETTVDWRNPRNL